MRPTTAPLTIERLGHLGDGIAEANGETVVVPQALPGEQVVLNDGGLVGIVAPSPDRIAPACEHFATCGGCTLQHLAPSPYLDWKRDLVVDALARHGVKAQVADCIACPPASRRRAVFQARQQDGQFVFGYSARRSHDLIAVRECPILMPELENALPLLTGLAAGLSGGSGCRVQATVAENGLDLVIETDRSVDAARMKSATLKLADSAVIRAEVNGVSLIEKATPIIQLAGRNVPLPSAAFLQAVGAVQDAMIGLVRDHLTGSKRIADLFCGFGTFALPLAEGARVMAADNADAALQGLRQAAGQEGLKPIIVHQRDLMNEPMRHGELKGVDGAVIDPPRAGALAQTQQIVRSDISRLAMVSCNPETLARDLAVLVKGGFSIEQVVPLDQFLWSPHVEGVALLSRKPKGGAKRIFGRKV